MSVFTRSGKHYGRPYSNLERLCIQGHRISGLTAWRLNAPEVRKPYGRSRNLFHRYRLGAIGIRFGNKDGVYVRQKDGSDKFYQRTWYLPFLVLVWVGHRFETHNTLHWLRDNLGLRVGHNFGLHLLEWGIFGHWKEVKDYLMKVHKLDLDEYFVRHDNNTKFAEKVRDTDDGLKMSERLEAANLVERGLGRIISIVAEIEKKQAAETEASATQNKFLGLMEKIANEPKEG